jgi:hypothetical protein
MLWPALTPSASTPAAASPTNPAWLELIQLVPIVTLALPFIVSGGVELSRAEGGLLLAAGLTIPVTALVLYKRGILNPILLGTALWLWVSALSFLAPLPALRDRVLEAQGFGLFLGVFLVGCVALVVSPAGFIGCRHPDRRFVLRASLGLLALAALALGWSWALRANIRLGGGLPFIVLNVVRRVVIARGSLARA